GVVNSDRALEKILPHRPAVAEHARIIASPVVWGNRPLVEEIQVEELRLARRDMDRAGDGMSRGGDGIDLRERIDRFGDRLVVRIGERQHAPLVYAVLSALR